MRSVFRRQHRPSRTLQNNPHRRGRAAENGLPSYGDPSVRLTRKAWDSKLEAGGIGGGKGFVVPTEAYVAR